MSGIFESKPAHSCAGHIEEYNVGTEDWIAQNFELIEGRLYIGELIGEKSSINDQGGVVWKGLF